MSASGQDVLQLVDAILRSGGHLQRVGDQFAKEYGLTATRSLVLGALAVQDASIADVARQRGLRRQSVQETMTRLEREGLVRRAEGGSARSPLFALTTEGRHRHALAEESFREWAGSLAEQIPASDLETALRVIRRLGYADDHDRGCAHES